MKRIIIILLALLFLSSCGVKTKEQTDYLAASIQFTSISSSTIQFKVNGNGTNLRYTLKDANKVMEDHKVEKRNKITNLESNKTYHLTIYDKLNRITKAIKTKKVTVLRLVGDVTMSLYFENKIASSGVDYPWKDVQGLLKTADISMANLETSVSKRGESIKSKGFGFRSPPYALEGFVNAGIDMVSIANNHILDYGIDAFYDTMDNLNAYHIQYVGAGKNVENAMEAKYIKTNGVKIGFMGATAILGRSNWGAGENKPGVLAFQEGNYEAVFAAIKEAKKHCDYLVFSVHWGVEYTNKPTQEQINLAHQLVDSGVDILLGQHPHVLQGIEYYKDSIIYYSVGNFIFFIKNDNAQQSGLFELVLDNEKIISSKIYPTHINNLRANLLNKGDTFYQEVIQSMNNRSSQFHTKVDNEGNIYKEE